MTPRSAAELSNVPDPAWTLIQDLIAEAPSPVTVLPVDPARGQDVLHRLQMTARSHLGALALHTGGVVADHGWFRLLGGGSDVLPDVASANGMGAPVDGTPPPGALLVGADALGGRFAIDGGALGVDPGQVCYFSPATLAWESLGGGHGAFVEAVLAGSLGEAFADLRWDGWQDEIRALRPDQGLSLYPPPFTREGTDVAAVSRTPVPISELFGFYDDARRQLGG